MIVTSVLKGEIALYPLEEGVVGLYSKG